MLSILWGLNQFWISNYTGRMTSRTSRLEEYSSSNVVRTLHPSRPLSPPQKHVEYNNNNLGKSQLG